MDQNVTAGALVSLDGSGSSDPDGDPITYAWTLSGKPAGSAATLVNSTSETPSFTADLAGSYQVSLVVNDGTESSSPDTAWITSTSNTGLNCSANDVHCVDDSAGVNQEFNSIQTAVNISQPGDVVLVFDGNYNGFRVSSSGTSSQRIKIVAQSGNANITSTEPFGSNAIRIQNASYVTIEGFKVDGTGFPSSTSYDFACIAARGANASSPMRSLTFINNHLTNCAPAGMYLSNVRDLRLSRNVVTGTNDVGGNSGMGIYIANGGADNAVIYENIVSDNDDVAIHFNGDSSVGGDGIQSGHLIQRNIFDSNSRNGLNMDGVQSVRIENNVFSNNIKHGIRGYRIDGGGGPRDWVIVNNTFYNNESPAKTTEDAGGHLIFNTIIASNLSNSFLMSSGNYSSGSNLFTSNPNSIFINTAAGDFRLQSSSAPVNGGQTAFVGQNAPTDDLSAATRSGIPDIGAFEMGSNYPSWAQ